MLNIELQSCGLAMLFILLLIFLKEKSLDLSSRRLFFKALLSCIGCVTLDILSIIGIYGATYKDFPPMAAAIVCKLYVTALTLQGYEGFLYAAGEFFAEDSHKKIRTFYRIWYLAGTVLILVLPIYYKMNGRIVYSYGPSTAVTYVISIAFILSTIYMAFRGTHQTSERRRYAMLIWQGSWLLAALIQFLVPSLLLVGYAAAFGMMIIYAELENPHAGIDRETGQYSSNALSTYVGDLYQHERPFSSMHIRILYLMQNVNPDTEKTVMLQIAHLLNQTKDSYIFRQADNSYLVIYKSRTQMEEVYERVSTQVGDVVSTPVKLCYILTPDSAVVNTADEFFRFHYYYEHDSEAQDCVVVEQEMIQRIQQYEKVKDLIRGALKDNRVEVYYQPFYNVKKKKFTAAEALVRIHDTDGNLVPPGTFIPIAEESGLIIPLGIEIFRQVCAFLATGAAQRLGLEYIDVNLSVAQFDNDNPAAFVKKLLEDYRINPKWINLEITETASTSAKQILLKNMNSLIGKGIHFSLDDFGTGRSNLDYFVEMPVSVIKFDFGFTHGYFTNGRARCVMESVVDLAHKMGLHIVAEGVETALQLEAMCSLGIEFIQGYYFSPPLPQAEFLQFLQAH